MPVAHRDSFIYHPKMSFQLRPATKQGAPSAIVPLTQGYVAFIDKADLPMVQKHRWYTMRYKTGLYAATNAPMVNGKRGRTILMHSLIIGSLGVDHKDRNGLNNRRENLRPATSSQNAMNYKHRNTTSKYRGVVWDWHRQKWAVYVRIRGKNKNLGRFATEEEAATTYFNFMKPIYGDFVYQPPA